MASAFSLSVEGVHFSLSPSSTSPASGGPIVSFRQIPAQTTGSSGSTKEGNFRSEKDSDIIADLSNFTGTLRISTHGPIETARKVNPTVQDEQICLKQELQKSSKNAHETILSPAKKDDPSPFRRFLNGNVGKQVESDNGFDQAQLSSGKIGETGHNAGGRDSFCDEPKDIGTVETSETVADSYAVAARPSFLSKMTDSHLSKSIARRMVSMGGDGDFFISLGPEQLILNPSDGEIELPESPHADTVSWNPAAGRRASDERRHALSFVYPSQVGNLESGVEASLITFKQDRRSSPLHDACADPDATINDLHSLLRASPSSVAALDAFGRTPLHLFANNEELVLTSSVQDVHLFLEEMIAIDPSCLTFPSQVDGLLPFVDTIADWIDAIHAPTHRGSRIISPGDNITEEEISNVHAANHSTRHNTEALSVNSDTIFRFPIDVYTTPFVKWTLDILSFLINRLYILSKENGRGPMPAKYMECRERIISNVASIPLLCKSLLLISDNDESHRMFRLPIILNTLLTKQSIGMWLVAMFRGDTLTKTRAINFLGHISEVELGDLVGMNRRCSQKEYDSFRRNREETFKAVANLKGIVPAMVLLSPQRIEKACTASIVHYVLDKRIGRPSSLCFMLFDITIYIFVMISYRINLVRCDSGDCSDRGAPWLLAVIIAAYFICRDILTVISMMLISSTQVWAFFRDWWNYVEFISMVLVIWTMCVLNDHGENGIMPVMFALTICLLWLKMIGFLKNINMHLSTFILAVVEIMKDMKWFLLVLIVVIFMFAEMIEILMKKSGACANALNEEERYLATSEDFCSALAWESYVRIYAIIVGDVSLEDFQDTPAITVLFIIFTFFGVIVLLNILIAIVNDSYAKSLTRSYGLFGKARVEYVARQIAREDFLSNGTSKKRGAKRSFASDARRFCRNAMRFCIFAALLALVVAVDLFAIESCLILWDEKDLHGGEAEFLFGALIGALLLFNAGLLAMILFSVGEIFRESSWLAKLKRLTLLRVAAKISLLPLRLFFKIIGMKGDSILGEAHDEIEEDDWSGRKTHLEEETRNIVGEAEGRIRADIRREIRALEQREISRRTYVGRKK